MPPWEGDPDSKARKRLGSDSATHWRRKRPTGTWRMVHTIAQRMGRFRPRHDRPQLAQHQMRRMAAFPAAAAKMLLQAILNASSGNASISVSGTDFQHGSYFEGGQGDPRKPRNWRKGFEP